MKLSDKLLAHFADLDKDVNAQYVTWGAFLEFVKDYERRITRLEVLMGSSFLTTIINLIITLMKIFH